ncbi:hypothetical protein BB561_006152 [Smittium simulii]|uniref:Uncharacterized protein n=1 Tax=Smittium simulii TaxID=133385 RepID=A0A2T9Y682_9FUNG|nr:hypothetical protein BB561_006152 [Smittium simulii]
MELYIALQLFAGIIQRNGRALKLEYKIVFKQINLSQSKKLRIILEINIWTKHKIGKKGYANQQLLSYNKTPTT